MRKIIFSLLLLPLFLHSNVTRSQKVIHEVDYIVEYLDHDLQIDFKDAATTKVKVYDAFSNKEIAVSQNLFSKNGYSLSVAPASILRMEYTEGTSSAVKTKYIATESLSTGTMNVYFNHPVETAYAQTQDAVNLSNTLDNKLIQYIDACTATLDIAIYNSYSPSATTGIVGAINRAYNRGVQVRLIYDGSTSSVMIPLVNASIPKLASPTTVDYGIMHNKFVIFDANNVDPNKPLVWTGSTNWTTSQIDGPDKNNVIVIQDQTLALAYKMEFEEMWGSNTATPNAVNSKFGPYKTDNTPHSFIIGGKQVQSYFSPSDNTNSKIINVINSANTDIDIASMLITRSDIKNAILNKYNGGLTDINMVIDSQDPVGNQFTTIQAGIAANHAVISPLSGIMHHKFMVVDNFNAASDPTVVLGSHNWSSAAENKNDENTLIVHDANVANQYFQAFAYLYLNAGGVFSPTLATNDFNNRDINFVVVPNPTNGLFQIQNLSGTPFNTSNVTVTDVVGKIIFTKKYSGITNETLSLEDQPSGLYFVAIQGGNKTFHFKLMKQ